MASISVIVPIYNVEDYLSECLDSLSKQTLDDLEVVMVDDGSTDSSGAIAQQYANSDQRFKYYYKKNGGLGHARNFGVEHASGDYITFLDSDDTVPDDAYERMLDIARDKDCEIVTGGVIRFNGKKETTSGLHRKAFNKIKPITSILESPTLIFDTTSTNKIYEASFFKRNGLKFPEGIAYEDIPLTMKAYCRAKRVGCTLHTVYRWRIREGSISQRRTELKNFQDRLNALSMMERVFKEEEMPDFLFLAMHKKWLDLDFKLFVNQLLNADEQYRETAIKEISQRLRSIDKKAYDEIDAIDRIKYFYISNLNLDGLLEVLRYQKRGYKTLRVKQARNKLYGKFPFKDIDEPLKEMTNEIARKLYVRASEVRFGQDLVISGEISSAYLNCETGRDISTSWYLVDDHGKRMACFFCSLQACKPYRKIAVSKTYKTFHIRNLKYRQFVISLPSSKLQELPRGEYWIETEYSYKGIRFDTQKLKRAAWGVAANPYAAKLSDDEFVSAEYDSLGSLCIRTGKVESEVMEICTAPSGEILARCSDGSNYPIMPSGRIAQLACSPRRFNLVPDFVLRDSAVAIIKQRRDGKIDAREYPLGVRAVKVEKHGPKLLISIDSMGVLESEFSIYLLGANHRAKVFLASCKKEDFIDGFFRLTIDLKNVNLTRLLRSDTYELIIEEGAGFGTALKVYSGVDRSEQPLSIVFDGYKYIFNTAEDVCTLSVEATRPWYESSKLKRKIIEYYIYPILRLLPIKSKTVVFESSWGAKTDCNPGAFYLYLQKNHPEYECIWLLNDIRIPFEGKGKAVRRGTLAYFYALARAHYFVNNVNFSNNYKKKPKQIEIQTMHGTPLKTLGLDVPGELSTPELVSAFLNRCSRWDYLVVQSDAVKEITKSCYLYNKKYLTTGYPRNDILFKQNNSRDIANLKRKYEIDPNKKLVLYAPTWRVRSHFDLMLDLSLLKDEIGAEYEIGLRVHQFAAGGFNREALPEFVHDFTNSESMEELFLISDIVITDYSSLMFDYALLNRPILFYVYDLEEYRDNLRGLYIDFEAEAPGPLLFTTQEVAEAIKNIEAVKARYSDLFNAFRGKYCMYERGNASERIFRQVFDGNK